MRTRVTGIETRDGRVVAVETDQGRIECEVVVNAAGMYAPQVARLVGVDLPIIPYGHQYLITEPFEPALEPLPTLRDPDNLVYFRTEVGGLVMGGYERKPAPWALDGIPRRLRGEAPARGVGPHGGALHERDRARARRWRTPR